MEILKNALGIFLAFYGTMSFGGILIKVSEMSDKEREECKTRIRISAISLIAMASIGIAIVGS